MPVNAGDDRPNLRQLDMVVSVKSELSPGRNSFAQCGQRSARLSTIRSGLSASARKTPGRPLRFFAARRSVRLALRPWDGGTEELSGVLGGWPSLASSSATRRANSVICASICAACASPSAISSSLESFAKSSRYILRLNHANIPLPTKIYTFIAPDLQYVLPVRTAPDLIPHGGEQLPTRSKSLPGRFIVRFYAMHRLILFIAQ
jgi:hypothetical protein